MADREGGQFLERWIAMVRPSTAFACAALIGALGTPLAHATTLLEAYQLAQQNDPKYRAAQAEGRANGTIIDQARAGLLPVMNYDAERSRTQQKILQSNNPVFGVGKTTFPTTNQTLSITQPIFRRDAIVRFAQAKAVVRQAELNVLVAEQDLMLRTTAAYLAVLAAKDSLALAVAEREALTRARDLAKERLQQGLGTITSQYEAAARLAVTQAREIEAQNKLLDARQGLAEITGQQIDSFQTMRKAFLLVTPDPADLDSWVRTAQEQNLSLRARREGVEVAQQEVRRQRAAHYPSLDVVLSHNRRDAGSTLFGGGSNVATTDAMLRLNVPLYSGGLTTAVTKEAVYRLEKTQEELVQESRAVERATRAAFQGALSGITLADAVGQSVRSQESVLDAKDTGYKSGIQTMLAVLDAQRDLYIARRDHAQARYDYLLNVLRLKQAAGTLSEQDLLSVSAALQ